MLVERFFSALIRRRAWVLTAVAVVSALAVWGASRVRFENSIEIFFLEDDPGLIEYREFQRRFQADEVAVVGVFAKDVFAPDVLARIDRVTRAAEKAPFAFRARSITNISVARNVDDAIEIGPLVSEWPVTPERAASIRRDALANPLLTGGLISEDGTAAAVVVELHASGNNFAGKTALTTALHEAMDREKSDDVTMMAAGTPIFDHFFYIYTNRDMTVFGPVTFLVVLAIVYFVFRRLSSSLMPITVIVLTSLWTFGLMGALGLRINVVTSALIGLILAVGVANSVHILADYYQQLMKGQEPDPAVLTTLVHMITPCFFTSATTVAGLMSLQLSDLAPLREFGAVAAVSVVFAFILSFTFIPCVLRIAKSPDAAFIERQKRGPLNRILSWLGAIDRRRAVAILGVSAALMAVGLIGLTSIRTRVNPLNYFREDDPVRKEMEIVDEKLGGTISIELLVQAPDEGLKDPDNLRRIDAFERWAESEIGFAKVLSVVDSLKEMNRVLNGGDAERFVTPDSRAMAAQFYLLMEGEDDFESMVQDNYSIGRITARTKVTQAETIAQNIPVVDERLAREFNDPGLRMSVTGFIKLMHDMERYLVSSQIKSFAAAFAVVSIMMILLLRSVRLGLFALIPNITPIVLGLAIMGLAGIPLDPGTVMIGSIAMGLVVDDTVHFLVRLRRHMKAGRSIEEGIVHSMAESGRPIVITSLMLIAGFTTLVLASFTPNIHFGAISAIIIFIALVADLMLLPAALVVIRPRI